MRKVRKSDELRPEYKREELGQGVRGKHFESYQEGTNLVLLSPDVAKVFSTEEAVNEALRSLTRVPSKPRQGWLAAAKRMREAGDDVLLIPDVFEEDERTLHEMLVA